MRGEQDQRSEWISDETDRGVYAVSQSQYADLPESQCGTIKLTAHVPVDGEATVHLPHARLLRDYIQRHLAGR